MALAMPLGWLGVRGALARWQLSRGDAAFLAFVEVSSDERLQRAAGAWWWARWLDPGQAAPHARLGYLADVLNDPQAAETHWSSAIEHEAPNTPAFRAYRTGLALSLGRQPARRAEAIKLHEANDRQPRAALELAMLHWDQPAELSRVARVLDHPDLGAALAGANRTDELPWGFPMPDGEILHVFSRGEQRCLLGAVRATTAHLRGAQPADPLTTADCQGVADDLRDLLCTRLPSAPAHPRAPATRAWLRCPAPAGAAASPQGTLQS